MRYCDTIPHPYEFGQKTASGLGRKFLTSMLNQGKRVGSVGLEGVPLAAGGSAAYGLYNSPLLNPGADASAAEKAEAGVTAGALGLSAGLFADPKSWAKVVQKTMRTGAKNRARGLITPYLSTGMHHAMQDVFKPKATAAGLALVPPVVLQSVKTVKNIGDTTGNVRAVSDTWKQLADSAAQKDQSGEDVVTKVRKALEQVSGDATRASGAIAQGTETVSKDISGGVKDVTGTVTDAARNIGADLSNAASQTAGLATASKGVAEGLKPLSDLVSEIQTKDESGKSIVENLNRFAANAAAYTDPNKGTLTKQLAAYGDLLDKFKNYAPYAGGGLLGAAGLYALYRLLANKKKKPARRPHIEYSY